MTLNFGGGDRGNVTISSNTTLTETYLSYEDLTVNSGYTLTLPKEARLFVSGTLTVDGTISSTPNKTGGTGSSGELTGHPNGGDGGDGGGSIVVAANTVQGTGTIDVSGQDGVKPAVNDSSSSDASAYTGSGNAGTAWASGFGWDSGGTYAGTSSAGGGNNVYSGTDKTSPGANASTIDNDDLLVQYLEDEINAPTYISTYTLHHLHGGSGGGGAGAAAYDGTSSHDRTSTAGAGGGGALGGGVNKSGKGGSGRWEFHGAANSFISGAGAGGGGSGGCLIFVCSSYSGVTLDISGGNGGDGGKADGSAGSFNEGTGGAGGGAGNGGLLISITDTEPSTNISGGTGGVGGSAVNMGTGGTNTGNDGEDGHYGQHFYYNIENF